MNNNGWTDERRAAASERMKRVRPIDYKARAPQKSSAASSSQSKFLAALAETKPPPCDTCRHFRSCATDKLACDDFSVYVTTGGAIREYIGSCKVDIARNEAKLKKAKAAKNKIGVGVAKKYLSRFKSQLEAATNYCKLERAPSRTRFLQIMLGARPSKMTMDEWEENKRRVLG